MMIFLHILRRDERAGILSVYPRRRSIGLPEGESREEVSDGDGAVEAEDIFASLEKGGKEV